MISDEDKWMLPRYVHALIDFFLAFLMEAPVVIPVRQLGLTEPLFTYFFQTAL